MCARPIHLSFDRPGSFLFFSVAVLLRPPPPPPSSRSLPKYPRSRLYAQNRSPRSSSLTATPHSDLALERDRMIRGRRLNEAEIRDRLRPSVSEVEDEAREVRMARTGLDEAMKSLRRQYKFMLEENGEGPTLLLIQQVAEKEIQGMTPRSTPPTRLGPYSGSKSKPPPPPPLSLLQNRSEESVPIDRCNAHTHHECPLWTIPSSNQPLYCEEISR